MAGRTVVAGMILMLAVLSPAYADWQYTKWGMSPADVVEASSGKATAEPKPIENDKGEVTKLKAPYTAGDYEFVTLFRFDRNTDRLTSVQLLLRSPSKCDHLRDELMAKYGGPILAKKSGLLKEAVWQHQMDNLRVALLNIGDGAVCTLFTSASNKGL